MSLSKTFWRTRSLEFSGGHSFALSQDGDMGVSYDLIFHCPYLWLQRAGAPSRQSISMQWLPEGVQACRQQDKHGGNAVTFQ